MRIIAGEAKGRRLRSPTDRSVRPPLDRIRESIFSLLGHSFEGSAVWDLFAGTGSFGLEALSRGASRVTFVERSEKTLRILAGNVELTGFASRSEILRGNALRVPDPQSLSPEALRLVFLDPPFELFDDSRSSREVSLRIEALLRAAALAPGGSVVLRCPRWIEGRDFQCPSPGGISTTMRRYGESVVFRFVKNPRAES